jgi:hypothetical protein
VTQGAGGRARARSYYGSYYGSYYIYIYVYIYIYYGHLCGWSAGKSTLADGSYYIGEWANGLRHGRGAPTRPTPDAVRTQDTADAACQPQPSSVRLTVDRPMKLSPGEYRRGGHGCHWLMQPVHHNHNYGADPADPRCRTSMVGSSFATCFGYCTGQTRTLSSGRRKLRALHRLLAPRTVFAPALDSDSDPSGRGDGGVPGVRDRRVPHGKGTVTAAIYLYHGGGNICTRRTCEEACE